MNCNRDRAETRWIFQQYSWYFIFVKIDKKEDRECFRLQNTNLVVSKLPLFSCVILLRLIISQHHPNNPVRQSCLVSSKECSIHT